MWKLEECKLPIFVWFLILIPLPLNIVPYRVFVAMTTGSTRKIAITPKLTAPELFFDMRTQAKHLTCCDTLNQCYQFCYII